MSIADNTYISEEKIKELLLVLRKGLGKNIWKNKQSILFTLKSTYGDSLDTTIASRLYDEITKDENENQINQ
jgi:hypothetical protein